LAKVYEIDGLIPVIDRAAYVHEDAVIIGDVTIGPNCYIGPAASIRGDFGRLIIEAGVNIQDTCVLHGFPGGDTVIEEDGHIGHGAVIHGCRIKRNALVGMNAVVMDGAVIGDSSIVGALSFVPAGFDLPDRHLAVGSPARILRELSDKDVAWKESATGEYQELTRRCLKTMRPVEALTEVPENRPRFVPKAEIKPLHKSRKPD
jgi:phenylacetic acid degradation protein